MAKLSELQQAYANPNMRKMLDLIAHTEGVRHGYNTLFGNERINSLGAHPNVRKAFKQTDGTTNYTTAAGRYQFLNGTWGNLAKQYGFRDFSPKSQDMGAVALIAQRGALKDVLSGNYQGAIQKLGKEWASLPTSTYKQNKHSWDSVNRFLGGNHTPQNTPQPQRSSVAGKWSDLTGGEQRIPVKKWDELMASEGRTPVAGNWAELINSNLGG